MITSSAWAGSLSVSGSVGVSGGVSAGGTSAKGGGSAGIGASFGISGGGSAGSSGMNVASSGEVNGTLKTQSDGSQIFVITNFNKRANINAQSDQVSTSADAQAAGEATTTADIN